MLTTPAFEAAYAQLNPRQRQAVDAIDGPVMVLAGPGTGKTSILTVRIAAIMARTDTPPEAILALTYTVNAAAHMQQRLAALVGSAAYRVTITTFHGLCEQIIHDHEDRFTDLAGRRVADAADRRRIMEQLFAQADYLNLLAGFGDDPYYIDPALKAIEELKREGVTADQLPTHLAAQRTAINEDPANISTRGATKGQLKATAKLTLERMDRLGELTLLYRDYETALAAQGLYDYSDMTGRVLTALEHDETLRLTLQERYQYLLVDEHQDTNAVQNRIVELLASFYDRPNLFIVGDEKQAIFRFQGASLDNFLYFKDRFRDVLLIALTNNYRSSQLLLDAAEGVRASAEPLRAGASREATPIRLYEATDQDQQYYGVGMMIRQQLERGQPADGMAVLYRRNRDGQQVAAMLARMGISYSMDASLNVTDDVDMRRLMTLVEAAVDYGAPGPLYQALHVPWLGVAPLDLYKLNAFCGRDRNPYDVIASMPLMAAAHLAEPEKLLAWSRRLAGWHTLARQDDPSRTLETIVQESGCLAALVAHPDGQAKLARLHAVYDVARDLTTADPSATFLDVVARLRYVRDHNLRLQARTIPVPGRVRLMTAHSAKGLEFDSVFMVDCYEKHWPSPARGAALALPASVFRLRPTTASADQEDDAEERNLFFVALTRARTEATICWPAHDPQGRQRTVSRYVGLIAPTLVTTVEGSAIAQAYAADMPVRLSAPQAHTPELADHEHLRERFIRQGLSATALNNYLACPWKYFYRNLVRIPEAPQASLMYGSAVDHALEQFFNQRADGQPTDEALLVNLFERTVHQQPLTQRDLATALTRGRAALAGWYRKYHANWPARTLQQVKIDGIPVDGVDGVTLNGKIDKLELLDHAGTVRVVDYKTGKPKSRAQIAGTTTTSDGGYLRQLVFYRALLDRWSKGPYHLQEGVIDFIDPDTKGAYQQVPFAITKADADTLMADIARVADEIINLAFWNRTCQDQDCTYCALHRIAQPS